MVSIDERINELELIVVADHLENTLGITNYSLTQGNGCVWAGYGVINSYYIFKEGKLAEIQYD
jgi:hypothetical protein